MRQTVYGICFVTQVGTMWQTWYVQTFVTVCGTMQQVV
jgi:hypothetical protein